VSARRKRDGDDQWGHGVNKMGTERGAGACSRADRSWASGQCGKALVLARPGLAAGPAHGRELELGRAGESGKEAGRARERRKEGCCGLGLSLGLGWVPFPFFYSIPYFLSTQIKLFEFK
jgi:hypothetical protein